MCVIHTHTEAGMTLSALDEGLIYTNQDAMMFYGHTAYHDFEGIALDLGECCGAGHQACAPMWTGLGARSIKLRAMVQTGPAPITTSRSLG